MKRVQCASESVFVPKCGTCEDTNGGKQTKKLVHSCLKKNTIRGKRNLLGHCSVLPLSAFTPLTADPGGPGIFRSVVVAFLLCGCDPVHKRNKQTRKSTISHPESCSMFDVSECGTWCGRYRPSYLPPANVCFLGSEVSALGRGTFQTK